MKMIHIKTETENSKDFVSAFRVCQTSQHVDWEPQTSEPFRNTYTKLGTRTSGTMPEHRDGRTETRSGRPQRRTNKAQTHRVAHRNTTCTHYRDKTLSTEAEHCGTLDLGTLEPWNPGTLEPWNPGTLGPWNPGILEPWTRNLGTLERRNPGTLEP